MAVKLNNESNYEHLCLVTITKDKYPKIYAAKHAELVKQGLTPEQAENYLNDMSIELELYYSPEMGLFAVDSAAVDARCDIYDPYTGELCDPADDDENGE